MSAEIIKIISTKQSYGECHTTRLWLYAGEQIEVADDCYIAPYFNQTDGFYELNFVVSVNGDFKEIKPVPRFWIKNILFSHNVRFLPMAIAYDAAYRPHKILVEFANQFKKMRGEYNEPHTKNI